MNEKTLWAAGGCAVGSALTLLLCAVAFVVWQMATSRTGGPTSAKAAGGTQGLVGKWNGVDDTFFQFDKDGTFIMGKGAGGIKGKYRMVDKNHFETDVGENKTVDRFQIVGNRLEIENEDAGIVQTFERAAPK